jgi:hypothetical protein
VAPSKPVPHNVIRDEPRVFQWAGLTAAIIPDSVLGVLVLVKPGDRDLVTFVGRFMPVTAEAWAKTVDSLAQLPIPVLGSALTLIGDDGSVLGFRPRSDGQAELIFRPHKATPYASILSREPIRSFTEALQAASRQAARTAIEEPPVTHDSAGPVFWLIEGDSATTYPSPLSIPKPQYPLVLQQTGVGGFTWLRYVIDTTGRTEKGSVEIIWASHPDLGRSATVAVRGGRFRPGHYKGAIVRTGIFQTVSFTIGN